MFLRPNAEFIFKKGYVTYRRLWLDSCLNAFTGEMRGTVLDLGGKRENKRGSFHPPESEAQLWLYLNRDLITKPNVFADVMHVPLQEKKIDCILCTEVLEHLPNPQACVGEIHRLLRDDGLVFASVPFFYPVHADPYDFQRFTEDGLRLLFKDFKSVEVHRMGGYAGVVGLILELGIPGLDGKSYLIKFMRWSMKWVSRLLFCYDLNMFGKENACWQKFTTGYFLKAVK